MSLVKREIKAPGSPVTEYELTLRLLNMLQKTKYELVQENGQRILTAPEIVRGEKQRVKGAEIFLGRLPRDCYEDELMPILERCGRLAELRLMLDFSGSTRGYAFALFEDSKIAKRACEQLDGYEIRPGHRIGAVKSVDNCRLFFGGVPKNKTKEEFMEELSKIIEDITEIYMYPSAHDKTLNRGFIFVEFKNHKAAAMARRRLIPGRVLLWGHEIAVDWADPEPGEPIDQDVMETVTALFVRNLSTEMTQQRLKDIFQANTKIPVLKLRKINHFAFIHYTSRQAAETVMNIMTRPKGVAETEGWEIHWAKPMAPTKVLERQRCIDEAIAKSRYSNRSDQPQTKQTQVKNVAYKNPTEQPSKREFVDPIPAEMYALQNLVRTKFNATCTVECSQVTELYGYVCKVNILRGKGEVVFSYLGELMPTKHMAISATCAEACQCLAVFVGIPAPQTPGYCYQQSLNMNPVVTTPVLWQ